MDGTGLSKRQETAHDLITKALKSKLGKSTAHGGNDSSHLQSLLDKGRAVNAQALGGVISEL